ncbi:MULTISPECIES: hypothetical protein [Pseudomonas]|nr:MULTISPECIES: hypothetical protein [Pseudomonas]NVZ24394.1 hypothetical protein [Pseudomonas gingeri]NVZ64297.1 hypothetical protein [Pseudomonas gingeri]NVZ78380.1 hypothetical protein [Pseudomonas gingeri]NWA11376.1 hypothetical protein [Pseudomonas gingeri]NWE49790.1 hypothetical protein [Pseudomonas gingeri]
MFTGLLLLNFMWAPFIEFFGNQALAFVGTWHGVQGAGHAQESAQQASFI